MNFQCADSRDRIFGTLGMIPWIAHGVPIKVDYGKSSWELALSIVDGLSGQANECKDLLRLLKIDFQHAELHKSVEFRRQSRLQSGRPSRFRTFHVICSEIRSTVEGKLMTSLEGMLGNDLTWPETQQEVTKLDGDQKSLTINNEASEPAAVVCSQTNAGDILVVLEHDTISSVCIVLRPTKRSNIYEVIGQGFACAGRDPKSQLAPPVLLHDLTIDLSDEDFLVLYGQDLELPGYGRSPYSPVGPARRLVTRVSESVNLTATATLTRSLSSNQTYICPRPIIRTLSYMYHSSRPGAKVRLCRELGLPGIRPLASTSDTVHTILAVSLRPSLD